MTDVMLTEKDRLTQMLSDQYAKNIIDMEEFEKMLELVNKAETNRDIKVIEKMSHAYSDMVKPINSEPAYGAKPPIPTTRNKEYVSIFSSREITINPECGKAGTFSTVFGNMKINVYDLPRGRTKLKVEAVFGSIEILVPQGIEVKTNITPVFGNVSMDRDNFYNSGNNDRPELYIKGEAVFGNISIKYV